MKLTYNDIPQIKEWIKQRYEMLDEFEKLPATSENLHKVNRIRIEARDLERTIKSLRGNMYPYAS